MSIDKMLGSRVCIKHMNEVCGTVRYVGPVHYAKGEWIGVELADPVGKNDGSVKGKRYFECGDKHGVFVKSGDVEVVDTDTAGFVPSKEQAEELKRQGNVCFTKKQFKEAARFYGQAIRHDAENHVLFGNRAACYLELDEPEKALRDAEKSVQLDRSWWKGHARMAKALTLLEEYDEAVSSYDMAIDLVDDPRQKQSLLQLRKSCLKPKRSNNAEPEWLQFLPPDMAAQARADPALMAMLQQEMEKEGLGGGDFGPPMPPGGGMDMDMGMGMGMGPMGMGMAPPGEGIKKQRLKKPILKVFPLHEAVKAGSDIVTFERVLGEEKGQPDFDINQVDDHGRSALSWACHSGQLEIAQQLLKAGANVNPPKKTKEGDGDEAEDDDDDEEGGYPLFFAVRGGHKEMIDLLLEYGADDTIKEPILGHNILHQAVKLGNVELITHIVNKCGPKLANMEDFRGLSPLSLACKVKLTLDVERLALLRVMLEKGGVVDGGVYFAAWTSDVPERDQVLAMFKEFAPDAGLKSDPPLKTQTNKNMIHLAVQIPKEQECLDCLRKLIDGGLDAKRCLLEKDDANCTPLAYACSKKGYPSVLKFLVGKGADINAAQDGEGNTALHIVGDRSNEEAWNTLIGLGAKEDVKNAKDQPPKLKPNIADKCVIQ